MLKKKASYFSKKDSNRKRKIFLLTILNGQMNSRNHVKLQKCFVFKRKNLETNILKMKNIVKLWAIVIMQRNIEMLHIVYII